MMLDSIAVALVGYLIGSVSFAYLIAKRHGVDILKEGSGNPGATNVKRVLGKKLGNLCFFLDFAKGALAAGWPLLPYLGAQNPAIMGLVGLAAAIVGHSFSVFLKFKGGKGVATTVGGLTVLMFEPVLIGVLIWLIAFYLKRYVSLASILLGVSLPFTALLFNYPRAYVFFALMLAVVIVVRHRSNIQRLLRGEESRFGKS